MEENLPVAGHGSVPAQKTDTAALVERFLIEVDIADSTKESYRKALRQFFLWRELQGIGDVTRGEVLAFKNYLLTRVQPTTAAAYLTAVKSLFKWLESEKIYPNVAAGVKGVKLSAMHRKDALTPVQAKHVMEAVRGETIRAKRDFALLNLLMRTGLRTIEVHRANVEDVRNRGAQTVLLVQGKGHEDKDAFVVLTEATLGPIRDYLSARRSSGLEVVGPKSPLFASLSTRSYGGRLSLRSLRETAKGALRRAGYDDSRLTTHSLRHTAVTLALLGGASLQQAQALARHKSISTTLVYSHNLDRLGNAPEKFIDSMLDE